MKVQGRWILFLLLTCGISVGVAYIAFSYRAHDPAKALVLAIIQTNLNLSGSYPPSLPEATPLIARLGPKSLPTLGVLITQKQPCFDRAYERARKTLPDWLKGRMPDRSFQRQMHSAAVNLVYDLGPVAARPLAGALCTALEDPDVNVSIMALRSLRWSIPESAQVNKVVTNWLANPARDHLLGMSEEYDFFADLPDAVPLLVAWLKNPHSGVASEVADVLGEFGAKAVKAIPGLITVCENGFDTNGPPFIKVRVGYRRPGPFRSHDVDYLVSPAPGFFAGSEGIRNRSHALMALGRIGVALPEVVAALRHSLTDTNERVRFAALKSLYTLHQPLGKPLAAVLDSFTARNSADFCNIMQWLGTLGNEGGEALPWLRQFTTLSYVQGLSAGVQATVGRDLAVKPEVLRQTAALALCRLEPKEIPNYLVDSTALDLRNWETVQLLSGSMAVAPQITAVLAPLLHSTNGPNATAAAYIILGLVPDHQEALATLRHHAAEGNWFDRVIAAEWLWERTGDTNAVLPILLEALNSNDDFACQVAPQVLAKMGSDARPAAAALKAALWNPLGREQCARALRKIAPEELPPIH